jgi:protoporphyrinogen oxidase
MLGGDAGAFAIVGGGPCGLAAAWQLAKLGARPIVLEREPLVGGLCATHERGGWRFDLGGHRFVSEDEALSRWLEDLLGGDLLEQERRSVVLHEGRRFRYPLEAHDLVTNLGWRENLRALAGYAGVRASRRLRPRPERSFEDWVVGRFGRPIYDTFFGPYTHKLWGLHPRSISADWAAERISLLNLGDVAMRFAGLRRNPVRTYARRYLYPRYGMGQLYRAMAAEVVRLGGEVRSGASVVGVETHGSRVTALHVDADRGPERLPVRELLSTMPLPDLVRLLRPARSSELARSVDALRFRAITFVNLMLRRADFSENTWMYVASGSLSMTRIQEPKRRSPSMAPPGRTSLMLEVPCDVGDGTWCASIDELRARMIGELAQLGFRVDDVIDAFAARVANGYPIYHLGYERDRRTLLDEVARFSNVRTAGRQGLFRYVFMDRALQMGISAARDMAQGRAPRAAEAPHEQHVVETRAITA